MNVVSGACSGCSSSPLPLPSLLSLSGGSSSSPSPSPPSCFCHGLMLLCCRFWGFGLWGWVWLLVNVVWCVLWLLLFSASVTSVLSQVAPQLRRRRLPASEDAATASCFCAVGSGVSGCGVGFGCLWTWCVVALVLGFCHFCLSQVAPQLRRRRLPASGDAATASCFSAVGSGVSGCGVGFGCL